MRRLTWGRWVLGVVLSATAGVGCDDGAPGGHKPDAGGLGGAAYEFCTGRPLPKREKPKAASKRSNTRIRTASSFSDWTTERCTPWIGLRLAD